MIRNDILSADLQFVLFGIKVKEDGINGGNLQLDGVEVDYFGSHEQLARK